jgi:hypothetical protein
MYLMCAGVRRIARQYLQCDRGQEDSQAVSLV